MKKVLCFIYDSMADFEMTLACHMLTWVQNIELVTMAYEKNEINAHSKLKYMPEITVTEALQYNIEDIAAILIPGGFERDCRLELTELLQKLESNKKPICAICAAPEFLAKSGILDNHKYTTTLGTEYFIENKIEDCFPRQNYIEENVVRSENLITAKGKSFIDFAVEILSLFLEFEDDDDKKSLAATYKL